MLRIDRLRASYSVPDIAIGERCRVVVSAAAVKIYRSSKGSELLCTHPRKPEGEHSVLIEHVVFSLLRKPAAMLRWRHKALLFPLPAFRRYYQFLKTRDDIAAEREFLRAVNLIQYVALSEIAAAMDLVNDAQSESPFDELKKLLLTGGHFPDFDTHGQKPLSPTLSDYDSLIPNLRKDIAS